MNNGVNLEKSNSLNYLKVAFTRMKSPLLCYFPQHTEIKSTLWTG